MEKLGKHAGNNNTTAPQEQATPRRASHASHSAKTVAFENRPAQRAGSHASHAKAQTTQQETAQRVQPAQQSVVQSAQQPAQQPSAQQSARPAQMERSAGVVQTGIHGAPTVQFDKANQSAAASMQQQPSAQAAYDNQSAAAAYKNPEKYLGKQQNDYRAGAAAGTSATVGAGVAVGAGAAADEGEAYRVGATNTADLSTNAADLGATPAETAFDPYQPIGFGVDTDGIPGVDTFQPMAPVPYNPIQEAALTPDENAAKFTKRDKRRRLRLKFIIVLLIAAVLGLGFTAYKVFFVSQDEAADKAQNSSTHSSDLNVNTDANTKSTQTVEIPNVCCYIEKSLQAALDGLGHGAVLESEYINDGQGVKYHTEQTISLDGDYNDPTAGHPRVFLSYNWGGQLIRTGYSATTSQLGFGVSSFEEMINNNHVIEKALRGIGFEVEDGAVVCPTDKTTYQTYNEAGKLVREMADFSGKAMTSEGKTWTWEAVLMYDYTTANATGNLADTLRQVYVYCLEW